MCERRYNFVLISIATVDGGVGVVDGDILFGAAAASSTWSWLFAAMVVAVVAAYNYQSTFFGTKLSK